MTPGKVTRKLLIGGVCSVAMLMNAACAESGDSDEAKPEATQQAERTAPMTKEERIAMRRELQEAKHVEKVSPEDLQPAAGGVVGEVPDDLLEKIYADLEQQSGSDRSEFTLLGAEAVQWNDGALGCPEPGQAYTQAIVDGYRVIIQLGGRTYDYHSAANGYFKLCSGFKPNRQQNPDM